MGDPGNMDTVRLLENAAVTRFRDLVQKHPDNELYRFSLGKALFDSNRITEAQHHFERALLKRPDWMIVSILIGRCAIQLGNFDQARTCLAKALVLAVAQNHEGPQEEIIQLMESLPKH